MKYILAGLIGWLLCIWFTGQICKQNGAGLDGPGTYQYVCKNPFK